MTRCDLSALPCRIVYSHWQLAYHGGLTLTMAALDPEESVTDWSTRKWQLRTIPCKAFSDIPLSLSATFPAQSAVLKSIWPENW
jgi:hypothetical protein